jgi:O-antigen/teichoic acid export membrane protein
MVAYFTDIKTMGYYSIASLIGAQIHNFFLSFGSFIFPRVSFKMAEKKDIARIYFVSRSIIALLGWSLIVFLVVAGDFIFKLWLGNETFMNSIVYIKLYLVFEAGMLLIIVPFYFINGTPYIRLNSLFEIVIRCSHFLATLAGFYIAGVNGMLFGLIISTLANIPFQYFLFHKKILPSVHSLQYLWVIFPVFFILGLALSENIFFQLSLIVGLCAICKFIYFDPARQYSKTTFFFRGFLGKLESK